MLLSSFGLANHPRYMLGKPQPETCRYAASVRIMGGRKTKQTDVPPLEDPDRKRVLNVLAQRRYRKHGTNFQTILDTNDAMLGQRQRQRLQELERKANQLSDLSPRGSSQIEGSPNVTSSDDQLSEPDDPNQVSYNFNISSNESFSGLLARAVGENGGPWSNLTDAEQWIDTSNEREPLSPMVDGGVTNGWATHDCKLSASYDYNVAKWAETDGTF